MILDSSAIVAILAGEDEGPTFTRILALEPRLSISAATVLEVSLVGQSGRANAVNAWLQEAGIQVVPFDGQQLLLAQEAHRRFGRGSGSPAKLNFGDCFTYALAKVTGEPLLFKGDDFTHTDVEAAWLPPDAQSAT